MKNKKNWGKKNNIYFGAPSAPHSFKNFRRVMRVPNMCLVLKLDNGKVVSTANEQTESQTESCQHPVPYYNIDNLYDTCIAFEFHEKNITVFFYNLS